MTIGSTGKVFFYPHAYFRERHIDTIRHWPADRVLNPDIVDKVKGQNVSREKALSNAVSRPPWWRRLPLVNVKRRPPGLPPDAAVYVWGAVMATGDFITDLDNPYSLVGYRLNAMPLWRGVIGRVLASRRCLEVRCMSNACRDTLATLFGAAVVSKARVVYPRMEQQVAEVDAVAADGPRFLFVGSQFDMKGGPALLSAFPRVRTACPTARLDIVTHLPERYAALASQPGVTLHDAKLPRSELWSRLMQEVDVLVHPTYVESFGMVVLEALAHGLAVIATDVYAVREMVENGRNGMLLGPPISIWDRELPAPLYHALHDPAPLLSAMDTTDFEARLAEAMVATAADPQLLLANRRASLDLFRRVFRSEGST